MGDESNLPIDRGWAWIICIACTVQTFIIAGVFRSYGLLFVEFMEKFDAGSSDISLMLSMQQILSSITSYFVMTVGPLLFNTRQSVLFGSFIVASAFFISSFVNSIPLLLVSQGMLFGFGISFVMAPSLVLVGKYFVKRRGFTNSILKVGGGLGALTFAPFIRYLLNELSLDGTLIILSAILFNLLPCGCLLRPLEFYERRKMLCQQTSKSLDNEVKEVNGSLSNRENKTDLNILTSKEDTSSAEPFLKETTYTLNNSNDNRNKPFHYLSYDRLYPKSKPHRMRTFSTNTDYDGTKVYHLDKQHNSLKNMISSLSNSKVALYGGIGDFSGSIANIPVPETEEELNCETSEGTDKQCCYNIRHVTLKQILAKLLAFRIFKNKLFLLISMSSMLSIIGMALANAYIPPYAKDVQISPTEISLLVSIISIADLVGKFITAFISDTKHVKRHLILAVSMLIFGVASQFLPLLTEFWSLAIYCGVYGLVGGFYIAIFVVVIIDFVGIDNLSSALGNLILCHGAMLAVTAPLLGYLRDVTGSYLLPFHLMGGCSFVGGCMLLMEPLARRWQEGKSKSQEQELSALKS